MKTPANDPGGDGRWLSVRVEPSRESRGITDALFAAGSLGVLEEGAAIVTHFPPGTDLDPILAAVGAADPAAKVTTGLAPDADWSQWRASVTAHELGRIVITPPWLAGESGDVIRVVIEPAMAFGTGEHATTRGVVRLMQQLPAMPSVVADLGSGSAVLSICAARLGADRVVAIELDHDAISNAEENVSRNNVDQCVTIIEGDAATLLPLLAPVGLVLANIISSVLMELLPVIRAALETGGHAILSGILVQERDAMIDALRNGDWKVVAEDSEEGWWSVLVA